MSAGKLVVGATKAVAGGHHGFRRLLAGVIVLALVAALGVGGLLYLAHHAARSHGSTLPCGPVSVLFGDTTTPPTVEAAVAQALAVTGRTTTTGTVGADLTIYWSDSGTGLVAVIPGGGGGVVVNADATAPDALTKLTAALEAPTVAPSCAAQAPPIGPSSAGKASGQQSSGHAPSFALIVLLAALLVWWTAGPWIVRQVARLRRDDRDEGGDEENTEPDEDQGAGDVRWPDENEKELLR